MQCFSWEDFPIHSVIPQIPCFRGSNHWIIPKVLCPFPWNYLKLWLLKRIFWCVFFLKVSTPACIHVGIGLWFSETGPSSGLVRSNFQAKLSWKAGKPAESSWWEWSLFLEFCLCTSKALHQLLSVCPEVCVHTSKFWFACSFPLTCHWHDKQRAGTDCFSRT